MLNIGHSYDEDFVKLYNLIRNTDSEILDIDGIGYQLDLCRMNKMLFDGDNIADVSIDTNANIDAKTVPTIEKELYKGYSKLNAYYLLWKELKKLYGLEEADKLIFEAIEGDLYINDITAINKPYCFNFSTYDVALLGLPFVNKIESEPPKHLSSFMGQIIHFSSYASNSIAGACGLADLLIVTAYYFGKMLDEVKSDKTELYDFYYDKRTKQQEVVKILKQELQSFIFSCNQPFRAAVESGFYNISIYDDNFLEKLLPDYKFFDGTTPKIDDVRIVQEVFLDLMNETLEKNAITFPVVTACISIDDKKNILDGDFVDYICEVNSKYCFMNIYAGKTSTLSSCCRLRSDMVEDKVFFNMFGSGSTKLGSLGVVSLNLPRLVHYDMLPNNYTNLVTDALKINHAKREIIKRRVSTGMLPLYTHGFMSLDKQYSTIGLVGIYEMLENLGYNILDDEGKDIIKSLLQSINKIADDWSKKYGYPVNVEQVPGENSAIKIAEKDRHYNLGNHYIYSNQFIPLTSEADLLDRIDLQGEFDSYLTGGSILHINVAGETTPDTIYDLIIYSINRGVIYFGINKVLLKCNNGHVTIKNKSDNCIICNGKIIDEYTRVVGFMTSTKNWHKVRRKEYKERKFYNEVKI